jgi:AraC-like DNA-binding protein
LCLIVQASQGGIRIYTIGVGVAIIILYVINFFIVRDTTFLNSITGKSKALDKKLAQKITTEIAQYLVERKTYRHKGLKVSELAKQTNYPAYLISQSINQHYNMRFNEFLNKFRVQEAMERLKNSNENDKIEVIAREVGFASMSSLYDAFKKETNVTPQMFRNQFSRT